MDAGRVNFQVAFPACIRRLEPEFYLRSQAAALRRPAAVMHCREPVSAQQHLSADPSRRRALRNRESDSGLSSCLGFRVWHGAPKQPLSCLIGWRLGHAPQPGGTDRAPTGPRHRALLRGTGFAEPVQRKWTVRARTCAKVRLRACPCSHSRAC